MAVDPPQPGWPRSTTLRVDALLGFLVATATAVALVTSQRAAGSATWPACGFAIGFGAVLLWRRRHSVAVLIFTSVGICAYYALAYPPIGLAIPIVAALFSVAEHGHLRLGITVAAGLVVLAVFFQVVGGGDIAHILGYDVPPVLALMGAALILGDGTRTRQLLRASQRDSERQARLELDHQAAERRAADHLTLARDLHDTLGHHLAVILLQSAVAQEALPQGIDEAEEAVRGVRRAGRDAMAELRDTVARLRSPDEGPDPLAGLDCLPDLIERLRRSGLAVSFQTFVDVVPKEIEHAAYLIIQEAVTNVIRHADATAIQIELAVVGDLMLLRVEDNGRATGQGVGLIEQTGHRNGHGIRGMRERAEALSGHLTVIRRRPEGGVQVQAEIPLRRGAVEPESAP